MWYDPICDKRCDLFRLVRVQGEVIIYFIVNFNIEKCTVLISMTLVHVLSQPELSLCIFSLYISPHAASAMVVLHLSLAIHCSSGRSACVC